MCKGDSKTFNSFVKDRKKDDMAPPDEPGYIAVECYGREAVRGGGWVSFALCEDSVDETWTPETKMVCFTPRESPLLSKDRQKIV